MSDFDILNPDFFELAEKAKAIYAEKQQKIAEFKEIWHKHKAEIEALDKQAAVLKQEYMLKLESAKASA